MRGFVILLFLSHWGFSQMKFGSLYEELPRDSFSSFSLKQHTSIRPYIRVTSPENDTDTIEPSTNKTTYSTKIIPLVDAGFQFDNGIAFRVGGGLSMTTSLNQKWYSKISFLQGFGQSQTPLLEPKSYWISKKSDGQFLYTDLRGRISYTPNHVFNFQTGIDPNFVGEGNRSMLLSDFGKPYPFVQIRANFWRIEYLMLYQFMREQTPNNAWKSKYASSHLISFNATKWLNFGIFETVIFAPKDTLLNRGFDAEYLNPVIFYRPQEYSLGSADNVLLGAQFSARYKKHTLYGQVILDEFLLSEIRARSRWWANKYAAQLGIKGRFTEQNQPFFYRVECNFARPYTYSHSSASQNYGHQGYALAHPYGSNFSEILGELKWQNSKFILKAFTSYFVHGADKNDGFSYGGDIYASYNKHPYEYNNVVGQGIKNNGVRAILSAAYLIPKVSNLQLFTEAHIRRNTAYSEPDFQVVIGIRNCLWNDYRNY
jgi:hypothetical protein